METRGSRLATDHATNSVFDDVGSHLFAMIVASRLWEMMLVRLRHHPYRCGVVRACESDRPLPGGEHISGCDDLVTNIGRNRW